MLNMEKVVKGLTELKKYLPSTMWEPINNAVALLKEQEAEISRISNAYLELVGKASKQPKVVRCKDCKHRGDSLNCHVALIADLLKDIRVFTYKVTDEWFCADGERKSDD